MRTPNETARHMIKTYGVSRAYEYASGYASGVYYEQTPAAKAYWRAVIAELDTITDSEEG